MNHNLKKRLPLVVMFLILVAGLSVMGYPLVSDWLSVYTAKVEIADYTTAVEEEDSTQLDTMWTQAEEYNQSLNSATKTSVVSYEDLLSVTDAIGYLEIPKIGVYMPIYHGIDTEVLEKGIGHMPETSLPVGGKSTHCVLSGHTGLPAAKILTDLDKMKEGDLFYLHVLGRVLAYKVDQIKVVLPEETDDIKITEGKDYVTLLTCTPYGINTERLLVRGHRIANRSGDNSRITSDAAKVSTVLVAVGIGIPLLIISFIAVDVSERVPKRKKKSKNRSKNRRRKATIQTRAKRIRTKQTSGRRR